MDAASGTVLKIAFSNGNLLAEEGSATSAAANVLWNGADVTAEYATSAFHWTRNSGSASADAAWNAAHAGMKSISLTSADLTVDGAMANTQITCTLTASAPAYGTLQTDATTMASHAPGTLDANDTFSLVDGSLKFATERGEVYALEEGHVKSACARLNGTVTAEATVFCSQPEDMVEFAYDHNGLRVQKKVTGADGTSTTTDYKLHGKRVVHQTVKNVAADGTATTQEMHFYSDAHSRPAMVEYVGEIYTYLHNLQGDIIGIVDSAGSVVVRYGYDAWGKPTEIWTQAAPALESSLKTAYETICMLNPFRYRGYAWDSETGLYYLQSRYYNPVKMRFVNVDRSLIPTLLGKNPYTYCYNSPQNSRDQSGEAPSIYALNYMAHNQVQVDVFLNSLEVIGLEVPVTNLPKDSSWQSSKGRIDLFNPITGEVWEVKKRL